MRIQRGSNELAGRSSDPRFYAGLTLLPNPDPVLRKLGYRDEVWDAIQGDTHVIGELQLIRGDLLRFEHRLQSGDESRAAKRALALCEQLLTRAPAPLTRWPDITWALGQAPFRGLVAVEVIPERQGDLLVPGRLLDRPARRFGFAADGSLRVITREHMADGIAVDPELFLVRRHMASYDNPYGVALFSSCYWPYVFKHGAGFKPFVKFCERHGLPVPVGTYPAGTDEATIDVIEQSLAALIDSGYIAMPDDGSVQLLEAQAAAGAGKLAQHAMIDLCNAEMSKALTAQTLSTELPNGGGSYAASQTARGRSAAVNESAREEIAYCYDQLWAWVTRVNFGEGVPPPHSEFVEQTEVRKERAEIYDIAIRSGLPVSRQGMAEELAIRLADPDDPDDQLTPPAPAPTEPPTATAPGAAREGAEFAAAASRAGSDRLITNQSLTQAAPLLQGWMDTCRSQLERSESLADYREGLLRLYPQLDTQQFSSLMARAMTAAELAGRYDILNEAGLL